MLAAGVSREAVLEALEVAWAFNVINRIADALGFEVGSRESFEASARVPSAPTRRRAGAAAQKRRPRPPVHATRPRRSPRRRCAPTAMPATEARVHASIAPPAARTRPPADPLSRLPPWITT